MRYSGFKTEKGSIYAFNNKGEVVRCKKSVGVGQNTVREPSECLFAPPSAAPMLENYYLTNGNTDHSIRLGMTEMPSPKTFIQFQDSVSVPKGYQPIIVVMNSKTGQVAKTCLATLEPIEGYIPVQKRYNPNGTSSTHIGNAVVEIYHDSEELARHAPVELLAAIESPQRTDTELRTRARAAAPSHS